MNTIRYLWGHTLKNRVRDVFKKPALLIAYLLMLALLVFVLVMGGDAHVETGDVSRTYTGYAAILVLAFVFIGMLTIWNGLKQGTSLFSMADVNLLFTAPLSPRRILFYGIMKQAGIMLAAALLMLFQYPNMRNNGLPPMALVGLIFAYALMGFSSNLLAAVVYAFSAGSGKRKKRVYTAMLALIAAIVLGAGVAALSSPGGNFLAGLTGFFGSDYWNYVPLFGWARGLAIAFAELEWMKALLFGALMLVSVGGCALLLLRTDMDYYEDVLLAAERANQATANAQEGRMVEQGSVSSRVKRDQGALWGTGAFAFTGRMLREQSRRGIGFFDAGTLAALAGPIFGLIFFSGDMMAEGGLWAVIGMSVWFLLFFNLQSGFARELAYPTIFLAPERPVNKLLAVMLPGILKSAVDGMLFALSIALLYRAPVLDCFACWLIYISALFLFSAGMLLIERILGTSKNKALIMMVYVLVLLLLCLPGIFIAELIAPTLLVSYFLFALWNALIGLILVFLCRNILHSMDMG